MSKIKKEMMKIIFTARRKIILHQHRAEQWQAVLEAAVKSLAQLKQ